MSSVDSRTVDVYRKTEFRVSAGGSTFVLRDGKESREIVPILHRFGAKGAAFLTAHNPYSTPQSAAENDIANVMLEQDLRAKAATVYSGVGHLPGGTWPPEPGFLAVGISREEARNLGTVFEQNAILWVEQDGSTQVELLR